jgi:hypothetical protein
MISRLPLSALAALVLRLESFIFIEHVGRWAGSACRRVRGLTTRPNFRDTGAALACLFRWLWVSIADRDLALPKSLAVLLALAACGLSTKPAFAESTIKRPGERPRYAFEAEPHLLLAPFDPPYGGGGSGLGLGFRGTLEVLPDGFLPKLNDSVGIGFGLDWVHYSRFNYGPGHCTRFETLNAARVCVEVDGGRGSDRNYFFLPVVMQWNFWLDRHWSAFAEPGVALLFHDRGTLNFSPIVLYLGGRYHFNDRVALTLRLGYPTFSLGASFFF